MLYQFIYMASANDNINDNKKSDMVSRWNNNSMLWKIKLLASGSDIYIYQLVIISKNEEM